MFLLVSLHAVQKFNLIDVRLAMGSKDAAVTRHVSGLKTAVMTSLRYHACQVYIATINLNNF